MTMLKYTKPGEFYQIGQQQWHWNLRSAPHPILTTNENHTNAPQTVSLSDFELIAVASQLLSRFHISGDHYGFFTANRVVILYISSFKFFY